MLFFFTDADAGNSHVLDVSPLDVSHRSGVAHASTKFGDAAVSTLAVFASRSDFSKKLFDGVFLTKESNGLAASVDVTALGECDHFLCHWAQGFCLTD